MSLLLCINGVQKDITNLNQIVDGTCKDGPFYTKIDQVNKQILLYDVQNYIDHIEFAIEGDNYWRTVGYDGNGNSSYGDPVWVTNGSELDGKCSYSVSNENTLIMTTYNGFACGLGVTAYLADSIGNRLFIGTLSDLNERLIISGIFYAYRGSETSSNRTSSNNLYGRKSSSGLSSLAAMTSNPYTKIINETPIFPAALAKDNLIRCQQSSNNIEYVTSEITLNAKYLGITYPVKFVDRLS